MSGPDVRALLSDLTGGKGDPDLLDYICAVLEDEHFEFGDGGEACHEAVGPFLVRRAGAA